MVPQNSHSSIIRAVLQKNELPVYSNIAFLTGGQVNHVYSINNQLVIKIQKYAEDVISHQVELVKKAIQAGAKVPKVVDAGVVEGKHYLLLQMVKGEKMSWLWETINDIQKQCLIQNLCKQLKILHSIKFDSFTANRPSSYPTLKMAMKEQHEQSFKILQTSQRECDFQTSKRVQFLKQFIQKHFDDCFAENSENSESVFVHNDLHFGNVLCDGGEITGILDFDFSCQMTRDFQLWRILAFFLNPQYYVEEEREKQWKGRDFDLEMSWLKKYYPQLFLFEHLALRIKLYFVDQMLRDLSEGYEWAFNNWFEAIIENGWLEKMIEK